LNLARLVNKSLQTSTTRGTLYELLAKQILNAKLNMVDLMCCGGANDQGLDIFGKWDLEKFHDHTKPVPAAQLKLIRLHERLVTPILRATIEYHATTETPTKRTPKKSLHKAANVLIQCKNTKSQITAKTIRELAGIYFYHTKTPKDAKNTFMVLAAAKNLSKQARVQFDTANFPLVYCRIAPLQIKDLDSDPYELDNWQGGVLSEFYCNIFANQMLKALDVEQQVNQMIRAEAATT
jgi:hypothetical protein